MAITQGDINIAIKEYETAIDDASIASQELLVVEEAYKVLTNEYISEAENIDIGIIRVAIESVVAATAKNIECQYKLERETKTLDVLIKLFEIVMK